MHSLFNLLLQIQGDTPEILATFIASAGLLIVGIAIIFITFLIISRQRRNALYLAQKKLKADYEKQLLQSQIEVQESTLSTVSKELHDNVNQLLSTAKLLINFAQKERDQPSEPLQNAFESVGMAIHEIRNLSKSLNKDWLQKFDLIKNLSDEIKRLEISKQFSFHFSYPDQFVLAADKQLILFRIVQEGIQNCIKHAEPKVISISITNEGSFYGITIKDDGKGFAPNIPAEGIGIANMKQRTALLGGTITWKNLEIGCETNIIIPSKEGK